MARAANAARVAERRAAGARSSSIYNGVSWHKKWQQWQATLNKGGVMRHLGFFDDEAEAAKAVDRALVAAGRDGEVNFRDGQATNFQYDRHGDPLKNSSPYHGVTFNSTYKKWGAQVYLPLCRNKPEAAWCAEGMCKCKRATKPTWLGQAHPTHWQEVAARATVHSGTTGCRRRPTRRTLTTPPAGRTGPSSTKAEPSRRLRTATPLRPGCRGWVEPKPRTCVNRASCCLFFCFKVKWGEPKPGCRVPHAQQGPLAQSQPELHSRCAGYSPVLTYPAHHRSGLQARGI